jgi:hypothetical protein
MIRPEYIEPESNETKEDIVLHNIKISDEYKNTETLIYSFMGWFKSDDNRTFQDLEKLLRDNDLDTHLIAKRIDVQDIPEGTKITIPNNNPLNEEHGFFHNILLTSCRPKQEAIEEMLRYHKNYESNFEELKRTGSIFKTSDLLTSAKDEGIKDIINCTKKYKFIKYSNIEALGYMIEDLEKQFGSKPVKTEVGKNGNKVVYGLVIDGMIRSPILFCHDENNEVELIDSRKYGRMAGNNTENNEESS